MLGSSLLLDLHPESMSCFASLYLASAGQHHIRWGEELQARGSVSSFPLAQSMASCLLAPLYQVLGFGPYSIWTR